MHVRGIPRARGQIRGQDRGQPRRRTQTAAISTPLRAWFGFPPLRRCHRPGQRDQIGEGVGASFPKSRPGRPGGKMADRAASHLFRPRGYLSQLPGPDFLGRLEFFRMLPFLAGRDDGLSGGALIVPRAPRGSIEVPVKGCAREAFDRYRGMGGSKKTDRRPIEADGMGDGIADGMGDGSDRRPIEDRSKTDRSPL